MDIVKALIPSAGIGSYFLPCTESIPQEMLPIFTKSGAVKPAVQLVVEEALASSLSTFLMITRTSNSSMNDFFNHTSEQDHTKGDARARIERMMKQGHFSYINQAEPLGIGHALWLARHYIGKEYCAILLPDELLFGDQPCIGQLMRVARQERASVIAVREVPESEVNKHGIISIKKQITPNLFQVGQLIEKPESHNAPSNLAITGRYILSPKLFTTLEDLSSYAREELLLSDAIACMLQNNERIFAYKVQGTRFDISTPIGWLSANLYGGMNNNAAYEQLEHFFSQHGSVATPKQLQQGISQI